MQKTSFSSGSYVYVQLFHAMAMKMTNTLPDKNYNFLKENFRF